MAQAMSTLRGGPPDRQQRHWVIGTAGHVDHGKTTLVRALTGVDTDRLPEEKLREMTIDLGFAQLDLPSGRKASLVDVPGHERFIGNMLAGATGIDVVLFVVAADEGVMPQTVEHLDILTLLGLETGIVVITKADLVAEDWLAIVHEDLAVALAGTFLAAAPVVEVSAVTGQGLEPLRAAIDDALDTVRGKPANGPARLPVDRVFTVAGFGTVVTGTLVSGTIAVGDQLQLLPAGRPVRVRSLQVHGAARERAFAGERAALNLAGLERLEVQRGDVLATTGKFAPTSHFDGLLTLTGRGDRELLTRARVHLHVGTSEAIGRVLLLEADRMAPGGQGFCQFHSETPLVVGPRDRFIIRSYSPRRTIGGGIVVDAAPTFWRSRPRGARATAVAEALRIALRGDPADLVAALLAEAGLPLDRGAALARAEAAYGLAVADAGAALADLVARGEATVIGDEDSLYAAAAWVDELTQRAVRAVEAYHARFPLRPGMPRDELRTAIVPDLPPRRYPALLGTLAGSGKLEAGPEGVRLPGFRPVLSTHQQEMARRITEAYRDGWLTPPAVADLAAMSPAPPAQRLPALEAARAPAAPAASSLTPFEQVHEYLVAGGQLVRVAEGMFFHRDALAAAAGMVQRQLLEHGRLSVSDFRQQAGTTRKYAVPLLEYFDSVRLTRRQGEERVAGSALQAGAAGTVPAVGPQPPTKEMSARE